MILACRLMNWPWGITQGSAGGSSGFCHSPGGILSPSYNEASENPPKHQAAVRALCLPFRLPDRSLLVQGPVEWNLAQEVAGSSRGRPAWVFSGGPRCSVLPRQHAGFFQPSGHRR